MDDEYGREGRIFILDVKCDSLTVEWLKIGPWVTRVVDLANLCTVSTWPELQTNQTHIWNETDRMKKQ